MEIRRKRQPACLFAGAVSPGGVEMKKTGKARSSVDVESGLSERQGMCPSTRITGEPGNFCTGKLFKIPTQDVNCAKTCNSSTMAPTHPKKRRTGKEPTTDLTPQDSSANNSSDDAGVTLEDEFDLDVTSSSEDEFKAGSDDGEKTGESSGEEVTGDELEDEDEDDIDDILAAQNAINGKKRKRNDPAAFSETMSKILSSHLTTKARKDPVLVRAKKFQENIDDSKLEAKARRALKEEKRRELDKGRVKDVVPKTDDEAARKTLEHEKKLRKTAQRGLLLLKIHVGNLLMGCRCGEAVQCREGSSDQRRGGITAG